MKKASQRRGARRASLSPGRYSAPGTAPGTLVFDPDAPRPTIRLMAYGPEGVEEREVEEPEELEAETGNWPVVWVNVDGLGHGDVLRRLSDLFGLHPLALEDVVNVGQRAKAEAYDEDLFVIAHMPIGRPPETEQVSMFLGTGFLLTIQQKPGDVFDGVRDRIRSGKGRIRRMGPDYLAYALLDAVVDSYFPVFDALGEELEELEEAVLGSPDQSTVAEIHRLRRTLIALRRTLGPHRELVNSLLRETHPLVTTATVVFLRDVYDHIIRISDLLESSREISSDLMATYLSSVSNRMNEVMKVLTIIATIFIPLGFIAGVYGMNFNPEVSPLNMPELNWVWGYPFALSIMAGVAGVFLALIWRRGWFK